jgi:hypothetical protein
MEFPADEVDELKRCYAKLASAQEGGVNFILIPELRLPPGAEPAVVEALFCPYGKGDGYTSRLFLSKQITHNGRGKNWNAAGVTILGKQWWAVSWNATPANGQPVKQRLAAVLAAHLEAFR